jgi:hypothetical protein
MAFSENVEAQIIGTIIGGVILLAPAAIFAGAAPLLSAAVGERGTYIVEFVLGSATLLFSLMAGHYYFFVLPGGKQPRGSPARKRYEDLRTDLAEGGTATRIYSKALDAGLKTVERIFRDEGSPRQRVFGMKRSAPLWTPDAFHCCLIIALVYTQAIIFVVWAVSGDVGPAEISLGLPGDFPTWRRVATFAALALSISAYWRSQRTRGWSAISWFGTCFGAGAVVAINLASGTTNVAGAVAVSGAVVAAVTGDIAIGVGGACVGAAVGAAAFSFGGSIPGAIAGFATVALVGAIPKVVKLSIHRNHGSIFWLLFLIVAISGCFVGVRLLSPLNSWPVIGPLVLFVGLITLLNAPFSWFSLGLTRALLWRGLERQLWWPYFYGVVDAVCAVLVIAFLACVLVIGVQTFDLIAARSGGSQLLNLDEVFAGLVADGLAPQYWWLYALCLSTMIPSLVNLIIGGLSLTRGIPRLSAHLHGLMRHSRSVLELHRLQIAVLLGTQGVIGVALGVTAQATLVFVLVRYAMPSLGVGLLDLARALAAFDLPRRVFSLF